MKKEKDYTEAEIIEEPLKDLIDEQSRLLEQYKSNAGQAVKYVQSHMDAQPQAVVVRQPNAGWLNFILQEAGFIEGRDFIIIPYDDSLSREEKALFYSGPWYNQILFFMRMEEEEVKKAIKLGRSDPQIIQENINLIKLTDGMANLACNGFAPVGGGYVSLNAVDVEKHRIRPFSTAYDKPDFWEKAEILYEEYKNYVVEENKSIIIL